MDEITWVDRRSNLKPFEKDAVHTLSYDEKPGIQAIQITTEDLPPLQDPSGKMEKTFQR